MDAFANYINYSCVIVSIIPDRYNLREERVILVYDGEAMVTTVMVTGMYESNSAHNSKHGSRKQDI